MNELLLDYQNQVDQIRNALNDYKLFDLETRETLGEKSNILHNLYEQLDEFPSNIRENLVKNIIDLHNSIFYYFRVLPFYGNFRVFTEDKFENGNVLLLSYIFKNKVKIYDIFKTRKELVDHFINNRIQLLNYKVIFQGDKNKCHIFDINQFIFNGKNPTVRMITRNQAFELLTNVNNFGKIGFDKFEEHLRVYFWSEYYLSYCDRSHLEKVIVNFTNTIKCNNNYFNKKISTKIYKYRDDTIETLINIVIMFLCNKIKVCCPIRLTKLYERYCLEQYHYKKSFEISIKSTLQLTEVCPDKDVLRMIQEKVYYNEMKK